MSRKKNQADWKALEGCGSTGERKKMRVRESHKSPPPKSHTYLEPGNVTLFRNRVFADIVKLKRGHTRTVWALVPKTSILIRRKYGPRYRETCRESHVMMEGETGVISLQGLPATIRS